MLEEILKILGSKHPMLKKPICINKEKCDEEGVRYNCLTRSGWKSYGKLIDIIYKLNQMGVVDDALCENIVEDLDDIITQPSVY